MPSPALPAHPYLLVGAGVQSQRTYHEPPGWECAPRARRPLPRQPCVRSRHLRALRPQHVGIAPVCGCGCTTVHGFALDCAAMRAIASSARCALGAACGVSGTTLGWGTCSIISTGSWHASAGGATWGSGMGSMLPHCMTPSCTWAGTPAATIALLLCLHLDAGEWIELLGTCSARFSWDRPDVPSAAVTATQGVIIHRILACIMYNTVLVFIMYYTAVYY